MCEDHAVLITMSSTILPSYLLCSKFIYITCPIWLGYIHLLYMYSSLKEQPQVIIIGRSSNMPAILKEVFHWNNSKLFPCYLSYPKTCMSTMNTGYTTCISTMYAGYTTCISTMNAGYTTCIYTLYLYPL